MSSSDRHVQNTLKYKLDTNGQRDAASELKAALFNAIELITRHQTPANLRTRPRLYTGDVGHAVLYLRLHIQATSGVLALPLEITGALPALIRDTLEPTLSYPAGAVARAVSSDPELRRTVVSFGRCGCLDTPVGPAVLELTRQLLQGADNEDDESLWTAAIAIVRGGYDACSEMTLEEFEDGDLAEILYGTTGYLYGLLGLRAVIDAGHGGKRAEDGMLRRLTSDNAVASIVDNVLRSGISGAAYFQSLFEESLQTPPLMWRGLHEKYFLGGIHGIAGVLLMLLQCPPSISTVDAHLSSHILPTVDWLLSIQKDGNIPSSITPGRSLRYGLCQFCHGAPGMAMLLLVLRERMPDAMDEKREIGRWRSGKLAESLECIWREGLVTKGLGLCHGVAGNAVPFLLQAVWELKQGKVDSEYLGKALAFLTLSTKLSPMPSSTVSSDRPSPSLFRTPDHPYSLFEGLAGAACIWADALVVLRNMANGDEPSKGLIGFPMVGGLGVRWPL